jgi:hypothetical protein
VKGPFTPRKGNVRDRLYGRILSRDFLRGASASCRFGRSQTRSAFIPAKRLPDSAADITFETLADGVDKCYSDFRNRNLDVRYCVHWAVRGVRGDSNATRESYLADERKDQ